MFYLKHYLVSIIIFVGINALQEVMIKQIMVPLSYAFAPYSQKQKFPIKLSFEQSETYTPFYTKQLMLYNQNVSMQTQYIPGTEDIVIGLKPPSTFIYAIKSLYGIQDNQIQFGLGSFTQLLINQNNYVESIDSFKNGAKYTAEVKYNFGGDFNKKDQYCKLQDSDIVKFDELLILQILNTMNKRNKITFKQNQQTQTIQISGQIENFPKISFKKDKSIFQIKIKGNIISYIPHSSNTTDSINIIGLKALQSFSKFSIDSYNDAILFKRTSQLFQLYIFLGYFFVFGLLLMISIRKNLQQSMIFIKNVIKWVLREDNQARVRVLRTQLQ